MLNLRFINRRLLDRKVESSGNNDSSKKCHSLAMNTVLSCRCIGGGRFRDQGGGEGEHLKMPPHSTWPTLQPIATYMCEPTAEQNLVE